MGFLSDIFGGGGKKQAQTAKRASRWLPPQLNVGGATAAFDRGNPFKDIPGSANTMLSPQQQALYDRLNSFAMSSMDKLDASGNATPAVPGYPGITPELYQNYLTNSNYPQQGYGSVGNVYTPNVGGMGMVRGASFDPSGMPQVNFDPSGMPQIDVSGMPQAGGSVNWSSKAGGLDDAYLAKSKSFLDAANPLTGFNDVAQNYYDIMTKLSRDNENNMMAATGDKAFLKGILAGTPGQYAMEGITKAIGDADLSRQLQGYQMGADAIDRNVNNALATGGYVQANDAQRLQQAIAQGQLDASTSAANAGNWLQAKMANANNWLGAQGLGVQAQQANAGNWLTGQGMNLQAQGMNQNADAQNIANFLQGQGMLSDASIAQSNRDLGVNQQTLAQNALVGQQANERFLNAMNLFGAGQNTINAETQRLMQMLAAGAGGAGGYDNYLLNLLGVQGQLASGQSSANLGAYSPAVQQGMNQSNFWGNIFGNAAGASSSVMTDHMLGG